MNEIKNWRIDNPSICFACGGTGVQHVDFAGRVTECPVCRGYSKRTQIPFNSVRFFALQDLLDYLEANPTELVEEIILVRK